MSEVGAPGAGASAPAPAAEPQSVPLPDRGVSPPNPATSSPAAKDGEVSQGQPPSGKERVSIDDAIKKAHAEATRKAEAKEKTEPKAEPKAKPETKAEPPTKKATERPPERERGEHGHFAPKASDSDGEAPQPAAQAPAHHEAPHRFSPEAKAEWANVPESVKAEVHRAHRELEAGHYKYKEAAEAYHEIQPYADFAKQNGTTIPKALDNYMDVERQVASDNINEKLQGVERVLARAGWTPQQYAAHITQQPMRPQEQQAAEITQRLAAAERENAQIKQYLLQQRQETQTKETSNVVTGFARERPRFEELSNEIASYLNGQNNRGIHIDPLKQMPADRRLQQAYDLAETLNPSASPSRAPLSPEPRPANNAGQKSIAGSPANGSDPTLPAKKGKHPSIDESLKRSFSRAGIS